MIRDLALALRARRAGSKRSLRIVREARRADVPVSWAFALVEQESGFRNVFGHDHGSILAGLPVTRTRVERLLRWIRHGGISNGVGYTQLTNPALIAVAENSGGVHKIPVQLAVGLGYFRRVTGGDFGGQAWRYNGDPAYQAQIKARQRRWHAVLV